LIRKLHAVIPVISSEQLITTIAADDDLYMPGRQLGYEPRT
jgi:hypothetical protein